MPDDEEFELMPHSTIAKIKHELEILKKQASSKEKPPSREMKQSIDRLNDNIGNLMALFKEAAQGMKQEPDLKEQINPVFERLNQLEEENKGIAEGILALADMIKDLKKDTKELEINKISSVPLRKQSNISGTTLRGEEKIEAKLVQKPIFRQAPPLRPMPPKPIVPGMQPRPPIPTGPAPTIRPPIQPPGLRPMSGPPMRPPSPLPQLPEAGPKKEGFLSKLFKK